MTDIMLPDGLAPANLHLAPSEKIRFVDSDMFHISERLRREVSPRLHVFERIGSRGHKWTIMEKCDDGTFRMVAQDDTLDGRVIEHCQYLIRVPFAVRLAAIEKANEEWEAQQRDEELERMYEKFGRAMWWQLEHDGFIEGRGVSFPKRGIKPTVEA